MWQAILRGKRDRDLNLFGQVEKKKHSKTAVLVAYSCVKRANAGAFGCEC